MSVAPLHVLNTRPHDRAAPLTTALVQAGYQVTALPLLAFESCLPLQSAAEWLALHQAAALVIVVSPMAAQCGLAALAAAHVDPRTLRADWVAVGTATAAVLQQAGLQPVCPVQQHSEGLLALDGVAGRVAGETVLVWRGHGGRPLIQQTLLAKGVSLQSLLWYRRFCPPQSAAQWHALCQQAQRPDVVLISSGEAWQHWQQLSGTFATVPWLLVLGERLQDQLAALTSRLTRIESLSPLVVQQTLAQLHQAKQR
jgi:uroporphyrinogen-III synthase